MCDKLGELHSFSGSLLYLYFSFTSWSSFRFGKWNMIDWLIDWLIGLLWMSECRPVGDGTVQGSRHCQHVRPGGKAVVLPSLAGSRCQLRQTPRHDSRLHDAGESWFRPIHQWPLTSLCVPCALLLRVFLRSSLSVNVRDGVRLGLLPAGQKLCRNAAGVTEYNSLRKIPPTYIMRYEMKTWNSNSRRALLVSEWVGFNVPVNTL